MFDLVADSGADSGSWSGCDLSCPGFFLFFYPLIVTCKFLADLYNFLIEIYLILDPENEEG